MIITWYFYIIRKTYRNIHVYMAMLLKVLVIRPPGNLSKLRYHDTHSLYHEIYQGTWLKEDIIVLVKFYFPQDITTFEWQNEESHIHILILRAELFPPNFNSWYGWRRKLFFCAFFISVFPIFSSRCSKHCR